VPVTILRPVSITHILMKLHFEHLHRERQTAFCRLHFAGEIVAFARNMFLPESTIGS
jgi:hypothetical protein